MIALLVVFSFMVLIVPFARARVYMCGRVVGWLVGWCGGVGECGRVGGVEVAVSRVGAGGVAFAFCPCVWVVPGVFCYEVFLFGRGVKGGDSSRPYRNPSGDIVSKNFPARLPA